ncbi:protein disulfide isomerase-like 5-2 isoform X2 [Humulus lupulus]|uniref:protein disulfide isomerase-like 5-2 isoform X2 n=1 Tax=Humulus lupulus TaxID=3486 RepID=UPI002B4103EC|nr:protein disulfide isomerase-like 5-2 isoform X2 [Humulus lupulus]
MEKRVPILLLLLLLSLEITVQAWPFSAEKWVVDGKVLELDDFNFDSAIAAFNYTLVDFYAPWCIHCKHLSPELDKAAPALAALKEPIVIAKVNADKFTRLATKYNVRGFPTLKLFVRGVPLDYNGPRKAYLLVHYLKKLVAPDVSILDSDTAISGFVEAAGADFPIYIGFGLNGSVLSDLATKYTKKAWFSVAKDFSENMMVLYDFDKVPALVVRHPRYIEQSVFYGPFEVEFLEDFVKQNMFPLAMPITYDTLKLLDNDERKIVLTIVEDEDEEKSKKLIRILKSAASANRDLVFAYVSIKQWEEFANTFSANKKTKLPKMVVWNRNEDYLTVIGSESIDEEDQASQVSRFLEGYREGRTIETRISGPSMLGFITSLISIKAVYLIVFVVAVIMVILIIKGHEEPLRVGTQEEGNQFSRLVPETESKELKSGEKED